MNCFYCPLDKEALLHITGPDSLSFLQGQTTCDTRKVDSAHALPGAYCTPKGRVVCDFLLGQLGPDHFAMRMRKDIISASKEIFGKYIIFSKAELDDTRDDWQPFAFWGPQVAAALARVFDEIPDGRYGCSSGDDFLLLQVDDDGQQFEGYLNLAANPDLAGKIAEQMEASAEDEWHALQIVNGFARIEAATMTEFVPQTLNYDLTGHISFDKGCYTGQEVVARLHYRGTPKRRTYLAELPQLANTSPGAEVYSAPATQSVGNIVNAITTRDKTLALVTSTVTAANSLRLNNLDGDLLTLAELPYSLAED